MTERTTAARDRIRQLREEAARIARETFALEAQALFEQNPQLRAFGWQQYTPYFNDGDTCEFGANVDYPFVTLLIDDEGKEERFTDTLWGKRAAAEPDLAARVESAQRTVKDFLRAFDEEDYLSMFGDHVQVTITREGATAEHYEHE